MAITVPFCPLVPEFPTPTQEAALALWPIKNILYGGAAGGGKSSLLLMVASQFSHLSGNHALIVRRTFQDLDAQGAIMDRAKKWFIPQGVRWDARNYKLTFRSGSTISFRHLKDGKAHFGHQGAEYTCLCIDEAGTIPHDQIAFLETRLRSTDPRVPIMLRLATNPIGVSREWLKARFVDTPNSKTSLYLPAKIKDNPHLPPEYASQFDALDPVTRAQLLDGSWEVTPDAGKIPVHKIKVVDSIPDKPWQWVRSWDFAATVEEAGKDPDWSSGILVGFDNGEYIVADLRHFREEPAETIELIRETSEDDGPYVEIIGEEEGGSSGKVATDVYSRELAGYAYTGLRSTGPKEERARIIMTAAHNGHLTVVASSWLNTFKSELRSFPTKGIHDDIVDSLSQGMAHLAQSEFFVASSSH